MFLLGGAAISWKSSKQTCVALSTAEVEYIALSAASQEAMWLQQLMSDLLNNRVQETTFEDNWSTTESTSTRKNQACRYQISFHL